MFPNWSDEKGLQKKYEDMDVGFGALLSASFYNDDDERENCLVM